LRVERENFLPDKMIIVLQLGDIKPASTTIKVSSGKAKSKTGSCVACFNQISNKLVN
jgi:hypothetical protein